MINHCPVHTDVGATTQDLDFQFWPDFTIAVAFALLMFHTLHPHFWRFSKVHRRKRLRMAVLQEMCHQPVPWSNPWSWTLPAFSIWELHVSSLSLKGRLQLILLFVHYITNSLKTRDMTLSLIESDKTMFHEGRREIQMDWETIYFANELLENSKGKGIT